MALPVDHVSGIERIRQLQDDELVFAAFDSYPWTTDQVFLSGLSAILGPADSHQGSPADMAIHARIFYYAKRIGVQVDFAKYKTWLHQNPDHRPPEILPADCISSDVVRTSSTLSWQQAAPKADLFIDRSAGRDAVPKTGPDEQPSYPTGFAEMLRLLQDGKEIPGIRKIPNTVARDPSVRPVGARAAPKKPWEKEDDEAAVPEPSIASALDTDFPVLDQDPRHSPDGGDAARG